MIYFDTKLSQSLYAKNIAEYTRILMLSGKIGGQLIWISKDIIDRVACSIFPLFCTSQSYILAFFQTFPFQSSTLIPSFQDTHLDHSLLVPRSYWSYFLLYLLLFQWYLALSFWLIENQLAPIQKLSTMDITIQVFKTSSWASLILPFRLTMHQRKSYSGLFESHTTIRLQSVNVILVTAVDPDFLVHYSEPFLYLQN